MVDAAGTREGDTAPDVQGDVEFGAALEIATRDLVHVSMHAVNQLETVSSTHLRALQALADLERPNIAALARALDVQPSTASRMSERLAVAGLVTRRTSPINRRATQVELTVAGEQVLDAVARARAAAYRAIAARMSLHDRRALLRGATAFTAAARVDDPDVVHGEAYAAADRAAPRTTNDH